MSRRVLVLLVAACIGVTAVLSGAILRDGDDVVLPPPVQPAEHQGEQPQLRLQWPLLREPTGDLLDRL